MDTLSVVFNYVRLSLSPLCLDVETFVLVTAFSHALRLVRVDYLKKRMQVGNDHNFFNKLNSSQRERRMRNQPLLENVITTGFLSSYSLFPRKTWCYPMPQRTPVGKISPLRQWTSWTPFWAGLARTMTAWVRTGPQLSESYTSFTWLTCGTEWRKFTRKC